MLVAHDPTGQRVYGWDAVKDAEYSCPECTHELVVKQGPITVEHFAHRPTESCGYGEGESYQHMYMKMQLQRFWPDAELEVPLVPDRRADCVLRDADGKAMVIECQASEMAVEEFRYRTADYERRGIPVLWMWHSNLFTEHHPPREWRIRAAILEDADRRSGTVIVFRWPGLLESWSLVVPYRETVYVRRVHPRRIAEEGEEVERPHPWENGSARTLWLPRGRPITLPTTDPSKRVRVEQTEDHRRWVWRVLRENGEPAYLGLFVSRDAAVAWLLDKGYEILEDPAPDPEHASPLAQGVAAGG